MDDLNLEVAHAVAEARRVKVLTRYEARKLMLPALGLENQDELIKALHDALLQGFYAAEQIRQQGLKPQADPIKSLISASNKAWYAAHRLGLVDEPTYMAFSTAHMYPQLPDTSETDNF